MLTVADLDDRFSANALQRSAFRLKEHIGNDLLTATDSDSIELKKIFLTERIGQRGIHIHIRQAGRINQCYPLLFRDYLVANKPVRESYAAIKIELAGRFHNDREAYYAIKDPHMDTIYEAAKLWKIIHKWQPDNSFR